jgi:hypothetical protein
MKETKAKRIFDKYNPASEVVACPPDRLQVQNELDSYAQAAANLYGIIATNDLANIINSQNSFSTTADEILTLLLPFVLKKEPRYCFYKHFLVHHKAIDDFDLAENLLKKQLGKQRYIPDKETFLKFSDEEYEDEKQTGVWRNFSDIIHKLSPGNNKCHTAYVELKDYITNNLGIAKVGDILRDNEIYMPGEKEITQFMELLMEAKKHTRIQVNNGFTPQELYDLTRKAKLGTSKQKVSIKQHQYVPQNDPCPCGSGKKFKNCCLPTVLSKSAQLTEDECELFFTTLYGLLSFVNDKMGVLTYQIKKTYPNPTNDKDLFKIRNKLWEHPALIDEYLASMKLPKEKVELLRSWRSYYKSGSFIVVEYLPDYAVMIGTDKAGDCLYGVKGLGRSVADSLQAKLPQMIETVLLPFRDKIIFDGIISSPPIEFGEGMLKMVQDLVNKVKNRGLITRLDTD